MLTQAPPTPTRLQAQPPSGETKEPPSGEIKLLMPADPHAAAAARTLVRESIAGWGDEQQVAAATLLVSELVSNALRHARPPFALLLQLRAREVRIAVADGSHHRPRLRAQSAQAADGGWGMRLVAQLANGWGVRDTPTGKLVWVDLACSSPAQLPACRRPICDAD